jgi:flagellin-like protein
MRKLLKSKKALSPVVAAIILIAVTVAVSIAVAAWMGSLTFTFMETEEIKITSVDFTAAGGIVTAHVRNTGTTDVVIISGTVNDVAGTLADDVTVTAGGEGNVALSGLTFTKGTAYSVQLLSSKGNQFAYTATATVDSTS